MKDFLFSQIRLNFFLLGVIVALTISMFLDGMWLFFICVFIFIYFIVALSMHYKKSKKNKTPLLRFRKTKEHRRLMKLKKKRVIEARKKHEIINNQVAYIQEAWQLSKTQHKSFVTFIEKKAYSDLYTKMTASLLPQLIKMIDKCIEQNQKGCKRDVTKRINELVSIMKNEIKKRKEKKIEDFEIMSQVYDHLINELK
jgi:Ca2+/Na+ antiporter